MTSYRRTLSSNNTSSFLSVLRQLVAVAGVVLLLVAMAPQAATAQQAPADKAPRWAETFAQQAETLLKSGNADMQAQALQLIVEFGKRPTRAYKLDDLRPQLYDILLDQDNTDNLRILALSALHATGPEVSARVLTESVEGESSQRVRRFMLLTLHSQQK